VNAIQTLTSLYSAVPGDSLQSDEIRRLCRAGEFPLDSLALPVFYCTSRVQNNTDKVKALLRVLKLSNARPRMLLEKVCALVIAE
jgi:hypothetical protein